jgi:hypothetical protein
MATTTLTIPRPDLRTFLRTLKRGKMLDTCPNNSRWPNNSTYPTPISWNSCWSLAVFQCVPECTLRQRRGLRHPCNLPCSRSAAITRSRRYAPIVGHLVPKAFCTSVLPHAPWCTARIGPGGLRSRPRS